MITKVILWFNLLERLVYWNYGNVILTRTPNILQFDWRMDRRPLKRNYNESLAMSLLEILCSSCSLCVLHVFFVFEGLWWKFFRVLEAWIHRVSLIYGFLKFLEAWIHRVSLIYGFLKFLKAWIHRVSLIYGFLKFLEAFELDSSELWDLGRWFEWFCFECSSYSRLKFLKLLEDLGFDSSKASMLLNRLSFNLNGGWIKDPWNGITTNLWL